MKTIKIPFTKIEEAIRRRATTTDNPGFCLACGEEQGGCEPDAAKYQCESCCCYQVYGAEEILLMGEISLMEEYE